MEIYIVWTPLHKHVSMRRNVSWYWAFHCFLTLFICFVGRQLTTQQTSETVLFISKLNITTRSPILQFAPMRTHNTLHCSKKEQKYSHLACHNHLYASRWLLLTTHFCFCLWCTCYCHGTSDTCTYRFTELFTLVLCPEIDLSSRKLSISHLRSTLNIQKWCMNADDTSPGVYLCKWYIAREIW